MLYITVVITDSMNYKIDFFHKMSFWNEQTHIENRSGRMVEMPMWYSWG